MANGQAASTLGRHPASILWHLAKGVALQSKKVRWIMVASAASCFVATGAHVAITYANRDLQTAMSSKNAEAFYLCIYKFFVVILVCVPLFALHSWLGERLSLECSVVLSEQVVALYLAPRRCYDIKHVKGIDNVDQRICEDIRNLCDSAVEIFISLVSKILNLLAFAGVLWGISPKLVYFLILYALTGTVIMVRGFGPTLVFRQSQVVKSTADLRFSLVRIGVCAESIAFYRGEALERRTVRSRIADLAESTLSMIAWKRHSKIFSNAFHYTTFVLPAFIIAPEYFAGNVEFGVISQSSMAFQTVLQALSLLVLKFSQFSQLVVELNRIDGLVASLRANDETSAVSNPKRDAGDDGGDAVEMHTLLDTCTDGDRKQRIGPMEIVTQESPSIGFDHVTIVTPGAELTLVVDLSFQLGKCDKLLIMGPSGCGKSSIMRVLLGLWSSGRGCIGRPALSSTLFVPQLPYMVPGSLRRQVVYPTGGAVAEVDVVNDSDMIDTISGTSTTVSDANSEAYGGSERSCMFQDDVILDCLLEAGVGHVTKRGDGLNTVADWSEQLSVGEQQRVAIARVLLHCPTIAFLDESTSAMDPINERKCYEALGRRVQSWVSIGHHDALLQFHTHVLRLDANGGYEFSAVPG